jgi:hypothetical protein
MRIDRWASSKASRESRPAGALAVAPRMARRRASDLDTFQRRARLSSIRTVSPSMEYVDLTLGMAILYLV